MTWRTRFTQASLRALERLPASVASAIVEFATRTLPENPERMSKVLRDDFAGIRSARRGDYRVLFILVQDVHHLVVVRVAHRRDAYRPPAPHP